MVWLMRDSGPDSRSIIIESRGGMIPADVLPKFFGLFSISEVITPGGDIGVGPALAYRICKLYGGSLTVENRQPTGIRLTVSLKNASHGDLRRSA